MTFSRLHMMLAAAMLAAAFALLPASASAAKRSEVRSTGGVSPDDAKYRPAKRAKLVNGMAIAPKSAPPEVKRAIAAANEIADKPYKYGGGHGSFPEDNGYDCSGTVSYVLHGADLLGGGPLDSSSFMRWGKRGKGKWITVYTNPGHAFVMIAGLRFDTGFRDNRVRGLHPGRGPRWGKKRPTRGFKARHAKGF
jgi:hypothetical protein